MNRFYLQPKSNSPEIMLDAEAGIFEIKGRSLPENTDYVYTPVLDWLDQYKKRPNESTTFVFKMLYLNTSSKKMLHEIFVKLEQLHAIHGHVEIHWYYEENDLDIMENGEEFCSLLNIPYKLIELHEIEDV